MAGVVRGLGAGWVLRAGQAALANGELERAAALVRRAVEARPRWGLPRLWLATVLSEQGDLEAAEAELDRAAELGRSAEKVAGLWRGRILIDHERFAQARHALEQAARLGHDNLFIPGYLSLASWAEHGDEDELEELGWAVPRDGGEVQGRWLVEIERWFPGGPGTEIAAPAREPRTLLQRLARWRARRLVERAARAHQARDPVAALGLLDRAEAVWLGEERALELRVVAHRDAAAQRLEQLGAREHDVELRLDAAEDHLELGLPARCLKILGPALEHIRSIDPNRLSWRAGEALLRGRALLSVGEPGAAAEALALARELWPTEVEPLYYLGVASLRLGRRAEGRRAFISACSIDGGLAQERLDELRAATDEG